MAPVSIVLVFNVGGGGVPSPLNGEIGADLLVHVWEISPRNESLSSEAPPQPERASKLLIGLLTCVVV